MQRNFGLIGYPLGHSFSKQYFNEKFAKEGLTNCHFENYPIESIQQFPAFLQSIPNLIGISVTIPYKEVVLPFLDVLSDAVQQIGATNSIHLKSGQTTAYNTDVIGFQASFTPLLQPHHTHALVLGTGGAAKAVQYVLQQMGIHFKTVSRRPTAEQWSYQQINADILQQYTVVINCTPAGMQPNLLSYPDLPYHLMSSRHYCYDLVYQPAETLFLANAKAQGALVKNGYDMLLLQAEASWKIWNS